MMHLAPVYSGISPAVFLDRDGTLNVEKGYLHAWADWEWLPGVKNGLSALREAGFKLVIVSNQSGIARGYYGKQEWDELNRWINLSLSEVGASIDGFYFCPHHPDFTGTCACRKPKPGLILRAAMELGLDLSASWLIGDKASDCEAGRNAGCSSLFVLTGYGETEISKLSSDIPVFKNFGCAVSHILNCSGMNFHSLQG